MLYIDKKGVEKFTFNSMVYDDQKVIITHNSSTSTIVNEITCSPIDETLSAGGATRIGSDYKMQWKSKLVCVPVKGEECTITHNFELYDFSVLAKEDWNWIARNELEDFGDDLYDYQFYFSVCKPLKNIAELANKGSRAVMVKNG